LKKQGDDTIKMVKGFNLSDLAPLAIAAVMLPVMALISVSLIGAFLSGEAMNRIDNTNTIGNTADMQSFGSSVFWDSNRQTEVTGIDWGILTPDSRNPITTYIRNDGNQPIQLDMTTYNWKPANASYYIILSWNYSDAVLYPLQIIPVSWELYVSPSIQGIENFTFDISVGVRA